jgi:hypothetical protein
MTPRDLPNDAPGCGRRLAGAARRSADTLGGADAHLDRP